MSNNESPINLSIAIFHVLSELKLNTSKDIIGDLEIFKFDITDIKGDSTISLVFKTSEVYESCCDQRILPVRISSVVWIFNDSHAGESSGDQFMENSETITTV